MNYQKGTKFIMEKATFGAGCFWGVEADFRQVKGVISTAVGYEGGTFPNPTYRDVCSHKTGHAEVVEVDYDPSRVSYEELLKVFWDNHDPTTMNRQGPDIGSQYRSVIFYHTPEQKAAAEASKEQLCQTTSGLTQVIVMQSNVTNLFLTPLSWLLGTSVPQRGSLYSRFLTLLS